MHQHATAAARAKEGGAADSGPGQAIEPNVPDFPRRHTAAPIQIGDHVSGCELYRHRRTCALAAAPIAPIGAFHSLYST